MINLNTNKVLAGLFGLCVGDALGVPYEFKSRQKLKRTPVEDMDGFGTHNQAPGTWSDDSSMTFCLVESLCVNDDVNLMDIAQKFSDWHEKWYWTPRGYVFDIGQTTRKAIRNFRANRNPELAGLDTNLSNGNGSLMRILPLAYYLENYEGDKFEIVHSVSAITHRHIKSKIACSIYVEFAINLLKGYKPKEAYKKTQETILEYYKDKVDVEELKHFDRVLKDDISRFKERDIQSSGYVIHTLEASLWSFLNSKNYETAVLTAVNLGEDTDTTGAVCGGLAGIYYGFDDIPVEWVHVIARRDDIIELSSKLYKKLYSKDEN